MISFIQIVKIYYDWAKAYYNGEPSESIRALLLLAKGPVRCNGRKEILIIKKIFAKENLPHILLRGAIVLLKYAHVL